MKLSDMGTTGLIAYIADQRTARRKALAMGAVLRVLSARGIVGPHLQDARHNCFKGNCVLFVKRKLWRAVHGVQGVRP